MWTKSGLLVAFLMTLVIQQIAASPAARVKRNDDLDDHLDPINQVEDNGQLEREKRKLPDAVFGTKNALLGLVFSASGSSGKVAKGKVGDGDVAELDRQKTGLDIPSELFANSLSTIRGVSKAAGDLIMNSARRFSVFVDLFRPLLGKALVVKGIPLPPPNATLVLAESI